MYSTPYIQLTIASLNMANIMANKKNPAKEKATVLAHTINALLALLFSEALIIAHGYKIPKCIPTIQTPNPSGKAAVRKTEIAASAIIQPIQHSARIRGKTKTTYPKEWRSIPFHSASQAFGFFSGATSALPGAPSLAAARAYTKAHATGYRMHRSDWEYVSYLDITGCKTGMWVGREPGYSDTPNAQFYGIRIDDCASGLYVEGVNPYGLLISNSSFGSADGGNAVCFGRDFSTSVQFCGVSFTGRS